MKCSHTVGSLIFWTILIVLMSTETVHEVSTSSNTVDMRWFLRNRTRRQAENTEPINEKSNVDNSTSTVTTSNDTELEEPSAGKESENIDDAEIVDELKNINIDTSTSSNDAELKEPSTGKESENVDDAEIVDELKNINIDTTTSSNDAELKEPSAGKESENVDEAEKVGELKNINNDTSTTTTEKNKEVEGESNIDRKVVSTSIETKISTSNNADAGGTSSISALRNKFLQRSSGRDPADGNSSIVIGPNDVDSFKRNFQNSNKYKDTIFEPILTTVVKTKTIMQDGKLVTVIEKNFLFYRDQTVPPTVTRVHNTTTYSNTQQVVSTGNIQSAALASVDSDMERLYESCAEIMKQNLDATNGVYTIDICDYGPTDVYCYQDPIGAGCAWTVFMRRLHIGDSFNKNWKAYKHGFGELDKSFFLGLQRIYALTSDGKQELGIFTQFETNDVEVEKYANFVLGDEQTRYRVEQLGAFSKTSAICRLTRYSKFSTQDMDSGHQYDKCAQVLGMGWWYSEKCKSAIKLSGVRAYVNAPTIMGVRPRNCNA